jgi:L-iditol 2-dehydrogenase
MYGQSNQRKISVKAVMKVALGQGNIEVRDIPEPQPAPGEVKIKVQAAGICGTDLHIYKDEFKSRPLGQLAENYKYKK